MVAQLEKLDSEAILTVGAEAEKAAVDQRGQHAMRRRPTQPGGAGDVIEPGDAACYVVEQPKAPLERLGAGSAVAHVP